MMTESKIPICLVTGFLGAGKTTFLKQLTKRHLHRRLVFLVNEFSPRDIDGAMVSESNPDVISVPGGSIFCKCLITEFIAQLESIPARYGQPEGLIIEASGMANPGVMATMLHETKLDQQYHLARIISLIDPGSFHKLRQTLPNITAQIEASDLALINKCDCYTEVVIQETKDALKGINPAISIESCIKGDADVELFDVDTPPPVVRGAEPAKCRDPLYSTVTVVPDAGITPDKLKSRLQQVEDDIYRLKGYLTVGDGSVYVDYAKAGFEVSGLLPAHDPVIVLIHAGDRSDQARAFIDWLGGARRKS